MTSGSANGAWNRALAIARDAYGWLREKPLIWSGGFFVVALCAYVAFNMQVVPQLGMWYDELFSVWAGDPTISFGEAFAKRILPDTNGPIYFSLVWIVQSAGLIDRAAFLVINFSIISTLLAFLLKRGWKHGLMATALSATALLLTTAPLLAYGAEGRVYGIVMTLCAVFAFEAGRLLVGDRATKSDMVLAAVFGVLAAWMHVFGALLVGSLATALIVVGAFHLRRRDVVVWGIVAGVATSAALLVWLVFAFPLFTGTTSWIYFNREWILKAFLELQTYVFGPIAGVLVAAGFIGLSLIPRHSRPIALVIAITGVLYFFIPALVSLKFPVFLGRYLLTGFPAFLVMIVFLIRAHMLANEGSPSRRQALGMLGCLFLVFPVMQGNPVARERFALRHDWVGSPVVLRAAPHCPEGEIRTETFWPFEPAFAYYLKGTLRPLEASRAPIRDVSDIACPVFAWSEDIGEQIAAARTVGEALRQFRLTNTTGLPLVLHHHRGGFVLARADAKLD